MKQKDIFTLAVRILGLIFLYHGFMNMPTMLAGVPFAWAFVVCYLPAAWWLLTTRWLIRLVFPDGQQEDKKSTELSAGIAKKTDA